jgi:hypothetical protein
MFIICDDDLLIDLVEKYKKIIKEEFPTLDEKLFIPLIVDLADGVYDNDELMWKDLEKLAAKQGKN